MVRDVIIAGAGPAGITAAVYAARKKLDTLVITRDIGGMAAWSSEIENYTGFQYIPGPELAKKFEEHLKGFDNVEIRENELVKCIDLDEGGFKVQTGKGEYSSNTVVIATGRKPRLLGIPGETEFKNKGVTYCATCDGPLFSGKDVAVIGGGNSALDAALQLIPIANRIYLITNNKQMAGDEIMKEKVSSSVKVEVLTETESRKVEGNAFVERLTVETGGKERKLDVQGVFIEIGSLPVSEAAKCEGLEVNDSGEIVVNNACETNLPGIFAAGDVTNIPEKQIIVACGQGCIASLSAFKYLSKKKFD